MEKPKINLENSLLNRPHYHGGNLEEHSKILGVSPNKIVDASASLVPFPLTNKLKKVLKRAIDKKLLYSYPDRNHTSLKKAIASWHNIDEACVFPGNGAAELFTWAAKDAAKEGISTLPSPGFSDYERALKCWDAQYIHMALPLLWSNKFPQDFPLTPTTKVIWITNPHNPTGQLWSRDSLETFLKKGHLIICDEAFLPLVPNGEKQSLVPLSFKYSNLIIIRSLTKLFGIAGLRLGYAISHPERLDFWQLWRDPWPVNSIAILLGETIMNDHNMLKGWLRKVQHWVREEGQWFNAKFATLNDLNAYPSVANFQLIKSKKPLKGFNEKLLNSYILLRDCSSFRNLDKNWFRISFQNRKKNKLIFKSFQKFLT